MSAAALSTSSPLRERQAQTLEAEAACPGVWPHVVGGQNYTPRRDIGSEIQRGRHTHASEFLAELPGAELHLRKRMGHISHDVLAEYVLISDTSARQVADVASVSAKWGL
jgi:hypothetical protein